MQIYGEVDSRGEKRYIQDGAAARRCPGEKLNTGWLEGKHKEQPQQGSTKAKS
jgi:hypothetical protein